MAKLEEETEEQTLGRMGLRYVEKLTFRSIYKLYVLIGLKISKIAYYVKHVQKLQKIKEKYDPCNVFSFPQSVLKTIMSNVPLFNYHEISSQDSQES